MNCRHAAAAALALCLLAGGEARAVEAWNSTCLVDLRQVKEDWSRIATDQVRNAVARDVTSAEQSYRKGDEQKCREIVARIKDMMR